jgi:hypothetical protein
VRPFAPSVATMTVNPAREPIFQHIDIIVIVFDIENLHVPSRTAVPELTLHPLAGGYQLEQSICVKQFTQRLFHNVRRENLHVILPACRLTHLPISRLSCRSISSRSLF